VSQLPANRATRRDRESGVALVELVLVMFPLVIFVGGVLQFGIAISNWHNLNRIANEGARWAALNSWPNCTTSPNVCSDSSTCDDTLDDYLRCEAARAGITPSSVDVEICRPVGATAAAGQPVTIRLTARVNFLSASEVRASTAKGVGDSGFMEWLGLDIRGEATMRLEAAPTNLTNLGGCT